MPVSGPAFCVTAPRRGGWVAFLATRHGHRKNILSSFLIGSVSSRSFLPIADDPSGDSPGGCTARSTCTRAGLRATGPGDAAGPRRQPCRRNRQQLAQFPPYLSLSISPIVATMRANLSGRICYVLKGTEAVRTRVAVARSAAAARHGCGRGGRARLATCSTNCWGGGPHRGKEAHRLGSTRHQHRPIASGCRSAGPRCSCLSRRWSRRPRRRCQRLCLAAGERARHSRAIRSSSVLRPADAAGAESSAPASVDPRGIVSPIITSSAMPTM